MFTFDFDLIFVGSRSIKAGVALTPDSYVHRMITETSSMNSDERAVWLEKDDVIDAAQEVATSEGQVRQYKKFLGKYMYVFIPAGFLPLT